MKKKVLVTALLIASMNVYAGTDGHVEVHNQTIPSNQTQPVGADLFSQYRFNGHGCHTATIKSYIDVGYIHDERKFNREICPGTTRFKIHVDVPVNLPA